MKITKTLRDRMLHLWKQKFAGLLDDQGQVRSENDCRDLSRAAIRKAREGTA